MKVLKLKQVLDITGLSRSTLYHYIQNQQFPSQIQLGPKRVGWVEDEVIGWIKNRIENRDSNASFPGLMNVHAYDSMRPTH